MSWTDIGTIADIPVRGSRVIRCSGGDIAIFKTADGKLFALKDRCPHKAGPLSQGIVHGHFVTCPLHNWVIDLASGEANAPDKGCTGTIAVRVEMDRVLVDLSAFATADVA